MKEIYTPVWEFVFHMKNGEEIKGYRYFRLEYGIPRKEENFSYTNIDNLVDDHKYIEYDEPLLFLWTRKKYLRVEFLWENKYVKVSNIKKVVVNTTYEAKSCTIRQLSNELDADKFIEYVLDKRLEYSTVLEEVLK